MSQNIIIYQVTTTDFGVSKGRIDYYNIKSYMFLDKQKALEYAFQLAQIHQKSRVGVEKYAMVAFNEEGEYRWIKDPYWPEFEINVQESVLNFDQDIINTMEFK